MTTSPLPDAITARSLDQADIADLRDRIRGAVHRPTDPGYPTHGFNVAVSRRPWAVIDVTGDADVAAAIAFAGENAMTVAVHATGHGATDIDGHTLLLRTHLLDTCEIDPESRTARLGAGVRWQTVIDAASAHGLAPLCGSAPGVGVVGFLSGGGIGPLVRSVGASSDHVRSFDVVTGTGELRRATAEDNAELFWGLRGGKATLGIITETVIDLLPITEIYGGALYFDGTAAASVLGAWRRWMRDLPDHASTSIALLRLPDMPGVPPMLAGRMTVAVRYASLAAPDVAAATIEPLRAVATPVLDAVGPMPYAAIGAIHADPVDPVPVHEDGFLLRDRPAGAVDALIDHAGPGVDTPILMVEIRALGGRFADEPPVPSALGHRNAACTVHVIGVLAPPIAHAVPGFVSRLLADLTPWATGGRLPNFAATTDPRRIRSCYDEDTVAWLAALAGRLDPRGVLAVGQVVR